MKPYELFTNNKTGNIYVVLGIDINEEFVLYKPLKDIYRMGENLAIRHSETLQYGRAILVSDDDDQRYYQLIWDDTDYDDFDAWCRPLSMWYNKFNIFDLDL